MRCVICKSDDIKKKIVDEEIKMGLDIVLYRVEVLVCNSCGERYYDRITMSKLENVREKVKGRQIDIEKIGEVYRTRVA